MFTTLSEYIGKDIKLGQHGIKPQPQNGKPALRFSYRLPFSLLAVEPTQVAIYQFPYITFPGGKLALDDYLRLWRKCCGRHHRFDQGKRFDPVEPSEQSACLLHKQPGGQSFRRHG